jgi:DNA-binding response OmpR family regulator
MRRSLARAVLHLGPVEVDPAAREAYLRGRRVGLTPLEFDLLSFLAQRPGVVWTREALLERVWRLAYPGRTRTVDVHIAQLRRKLGEPELILTVRGVGYAAAARAGKDRGHATEPPPNGYPGRGNGKRSEPDAARRSAAL